MPTPKVMPERKDHEGDLDVVGEQPAREGRGLIGRVAAAVFLLAADALAGVCAWCISGIIAPSE